jgi:PAS domain-containing protein
MVSAEASPQVEPSRLQGALDAVRLGFQIIGFDWTYIYLNPAAAKHGRRTPRLLVGQKIIDAYPGIEETALFQALSDCMANRVCRSFENQFTYPDGESRWFDIRIEPVPEGICVYSFDIQERREAQLALERRNRELEAAATVPGWRRLLGRAGIAASGK